MKNRTLLLAFIGIATLTVFSCQDTDLPKRSVLDPALMEERPDGVVPLDHEVYDFLYKKEEYSWKELDRFYRDVILRREADKDYFLSLRMMAIEFLVNHYPFLAEADAETIEFYTDEQRQFKYVLPATFLKCLQALEGKRPDDTLKALAREMHEKSLGHIQDKFDDPEKMLERHGGDYEKLRQYGFGA